VLGEQNPVQRDSERNLCLFRRAEQARLGSGAYVDATAAQSFSNGTVAVLVEMEADCAGHRRGLTRLPKAFNDSLQDGSELSGASGFRCLSLSWRSEGDFAFIWATNASPAAMSASIRSLCS